jgi:heme/copper-type cytochrome/quinol oxidase subunit 2
MRGSVVVENESAYQAWLQKQQTFAQLSARAKKVNLRQ